MSLDPDYIRKSLYRDEDQLSDEEIDFYISRYTKIILVDAGMTEEDLKNIENAEFFFEEALIAAIGCELIRKDPQDFYIKRQKVGDTEEEFDSFLSLPSWCDDYKLNLDKLLNLERPIHKVAPFKRKWQSSRRGWYHKF